MRFFLAIGVLASASFLQAQAVPTASRLGDLQIGAGFGIANSDYSSNRFKGIAAYTTFDFKPHFGVEADFRLLKGPDSLYEKTYEIGGRYHRTYGRFVPYGKIMIGRGVFNFQKDIANLAYNMYAVGAGVDYKLVPSVNLRADYEYQHWSGFPPHGLTPNVLTLGAAYHFH